MAIVSVLAAGSMQTHALTRRSGLSTRVPWQRGGDLARGWWDINKDNNCCGTIVGLRDITVERGPECRAFCVAVHYLTDYTPYSCKASLSVRDAVFADI